MISRKTYGWLFLILLLVGGAILLSMSQPPQPEGVERQRALLQASTGAGADPVSLPMQGADEPVIIHPPVSASSIDLSHPLPEVEIVNSPFQLWEKGETDLDENDGLVSSAERAALQAEALDLAPIDLSRFNNSSAPDGYSVALAFPSIDIGECCGSGGAVPPDPELAVGLNHVIAVVNIAFEIYDKEGNTLVGATTFNSFFSGVSGCGNAGLFDPNVLYDEKADRYFMGIDANGTGYCVAVSQTNDPTGSWYRYRFGTNSSGYFFDYPHAGVGSHAIYMGGNMFLGNSFVQSRIWAFDKWAMYAGAPAAAVERIVPYSVQVSEDTPQPANLHGARQGTWPAGGPHYFITETGFNGASYSVFAWSDPFGSNTLVKTGTFNLNTATGVTAGLPLNVPQSGGSPILANDWRPQDAEYRNGYIWTVTTISCNPGGGTVNCVRWAQINPVSATVVQAGVLASSGQYRFFGDLAVTHCNDVAVGYTRSNSGSFPAEYVAAREWKDGPNTLQPEQLLKAGEITYFDASPSNPYRWGDYTGMTSDPNGEDLWYLGQYSKITGSPLGRWGTYIGKIVFNDPAPTTDPPAGSLGFDVYLPLTYTGIRCR